jgi:hypothetical protein
MKWRRKVDNARREVKWARQRVVRGWDDRAMWSLDDHLAKTLGEQLVWMSKILHGHPCDYPDKEWTADLLKHGEALLNYQRLHYESYGDDWDAAYRPAQDALRWVADNLASLWD